MAIPNYNTLEEVRVFLAGSNALSFQISDKNARYRWIQKMLRRFKFKTLRKRDKGVILRYIEKVTGYSRQQVTRLVAKFRKTQQVKRKRSKRSGFQKKYTKDDIALLAETDKAYGTLCGALMKNVFKRAVNLFNLEAFKRLAEISPSHIYNLRQSEDYKIKGPPKKIKPSNRDGIGTRTKPRPLGAPGYIRVDTVHQAHYKKQKGVYHINAVDEVTQFQVVATVERITEEFMLPALRDMIDQFPMKILNFHSDNGAEFINREVAKMLNKKRIELTKSRPRCSSDNGLVESKNNSSVRRHFGYSHIAPHYANAINDFNRSHLNPFLNYHKPCHFSETTVDSKGREKRKYPAKDVMTPYEKFKSLPNADQYLKSRNSFKRLDKKAYLQTDIEAALSFNKAKQRLFNTFVIHRAPAEVQAIGAPPQTPVAV